MINIWYDLVFGWKRDMSYVPSQLWWSKFTTRNFCDRLEPPQRFTKRDEQMPLKLKAYILQKVIPQVFFSTFTDVSIQFLFYCSSPDFAVKTYPGVLGEVDPDSIPSNDAMNLMPDGQQMLGRQPLMALSHDKNILLGCYLTTPQSSAFL